MPQFNVIKNRMCTCCIGPGPNCGKQCGIPPLIPEQTELLRINAK